MYWIILILTTLIYLFYIKTTTNNDFFNKLGIKYEKPEYLFGTIGMSVLAKKQAISDILTRLYNKYPKEKLFGIFDLTNPIIIIRDVNLIKKLFIKDFDHFTDRFVIEESKNNSIMTVALISLPGLKWRKMRSTLTPIFTSSKIKNMFQFMHRCAVQLTDYLNSSSDTSIQSNLDLDEIYSRYFIDTLASCAFGIIVNSHKDRNNYFITYAQDLMDGSLKLNLRTYMLFYLPKLAEFLNIKILTDVVDKFGSLILEQMRIRSEKNIYLPDMIGLLLQINDDKLPQENNVTENSTSPPYKTKWTDDELVAQCIQFLQAGTDSIASSMKTGTTELAMNSNVQEKLYKEIMETESELNGNQINYEKIMSMKYLDMVVSEILRKRLTPGALSRVCTKDYVLDDDEFLQINIKKGTMLWIPVCQIHYDPKFFPNPNEFDPERFNAENIHKVIPGSYLPFGIGPRKCIASRLGLLTLKTALYCLVKEFKFENYIENTEMKIRLQRRLK